MKTRISSRKKCEYGGSQHFSNIHGSKSSIHFLIFFIDRNTLPFPVRSSVHSFDTSTVYVYIAQVHLGIIVPEQSKVSMKKKNHTKGTRGMGAKRLSYVNQSCVDL